MKFVIATGIYPPAIGGPAPYAKALKEAIERSGHTVKVLTYGPLERAIPFGLRHIVVFWRAFFMLVGMDALITLDTMSAGLPSVLAAKILRVPSSVRIGGDFLWESYVERTHEPVSLPAFYADLHALSFKERAIFRFTHILLSSVDRVVFTTKWQELLWKVPYHIPSKKIVIIENAYDLAALSHTPVTVEKCFLWAGRPITLKNLDLLGRVFDHLKTKGSSARLECVTGLTKEELTKKIHDSYALILPSFSDVSPNIILEGIRAGKPFILTKHTGIAERLRAAGYFIDPFKEDEIKDAVIQLCKDGPYTECQEALKSFTYRHSYDDIAKEYIDLYKAIA